MWFILLSFADLHQKTPKGQVFEKLNFYRPQRSWGKVMILHVSVILFTGAGLPHCILGYTPPPSLGPEAGTPLRREEGTIHPGPDPGTPQGPEAGTPPGADPPPSIVHAWRYGQQVGGTHPTRMQILFLF